MRGSFALRLAWREARANGRRIGAYMAAIAMGVAALVAVNSFRANVTRSIRTEARTLLGGDLRLESNTPFPEAATALLDSLAASGIPVSYVTSTASMVYDPASGRSRLFQLRAVRGPYPHYSTPATDPPGLWGELEERGIALADPALLVQLGVEVGDTLQIGAHRFELAGTVTGLPSEVGIQTAIGPRVYIGATFLERTELIRFGSLVEYQAFLRLGEGEAREIERRHGDRLREERVRVRTAEAQARSLIRAYGSFADFLAMVGLTALLLGGVGVASAIHVFVEEKTTTVAVLRCLGATRRAAFAAYLLQAAVLGFAGSAAGVAAGILLQAALPAALGEILPVDVAFAIEPGPVASGLAIGVWVAVLFSLLPLLSLRHVSPLEALRRDIEPGARGGLDGARIAVLVALAGSVVALSIWQAPDAATGLWYATGLGGTTAALWGTGALLVRATRRYFPRRAPYVVRQGIANLFRPRNQTVVVVLSIGFGVFLVATLHMVQAALLGRLALDDAPSRPSILLFDVQPDQWPGIEALVRERGLPPFEVTPFIPARIAEIGGRSVEELLRADEGARWALRREYRNTYRDTLVASESLVAGAWWGYAGEGGAGEAAGAEPGGGAGAAGRVWRISLEDELARSVRLGDTIVWDVQGVRIASTVASLRAVDWTALAPNSFVVFEPAALERAPQTLVVLGRVDDPEARAELQRDVVAYPNVSVLDLTVVQEAVDAIAGRIALGIRVLGIFILSGGVFVLAGAVTTARRQRRRECALLGVLGATRQQVARILLAEFAALGAVAAATGLLLATVAAWLLTERLLGLDFVLPVGSVAAIGSGVVLLAIAVGASGSVDALRRPPLAILRESAE